MTPQEAVVLVGRWPDDRSVPRRLAEAAAKASGEERWQLMSLVEALMTAATTAEDFDLIAKHFPE